MKNDMADTVDFVSHELQKLVPIEEAVPSGSVLLHATKNADMVVRDGFRISDELLSVYRGLGHSGYSARGDRVSLTWSLTRAQRYLQALNQLVLAANGECSPVEVMDLFLSHALLSWSDIAPGSPGAEKLGMAFWFDHGWLSVDELWDHFGSPPADVRALWSACASKIGVSAWECLMIMDKEVLKHRNLDDALGVAQPEQGRFQRAYASSLAILCVEVAPMSLVDLRPEEEEVQVRLEDICGCRRYVPAR